MSKTRKEFNILKNDSGIAIIMVLSAITLLTFFVYEFAFNSRLNSMRISGQQNTLQAKLNAQAGIRLAISKLRLYKEGYNLIQSDKKIRDMISPSLIQEVATMPFVYPIPLGPDANLIQKNALQEFEKESLIQGGMNIEIIPVSGYLNPNNMRVKKTEKKDGEDGDEPPPSSDEDETKFTVHSFIEKEILKSIEETLEKKKEDDEVFDSLYGDTEANLLVKELKYFLTDKGKFEDDEKSDVEGLYMDKGITPKFAPLTSLTELYLLEGWNDDFVELFKDKLSVHEVAVISVNKLTESQLKLLFPEITEEQSADFFKYRDGDPNADPEDENDDGSPHPFDSENDFKEAIVNKFQIASEEQYKERSSELKKAGLRFGVAGKLFKVISTGRMDNASYTIKAYVDLPLKPLPKATPVVEPTPTGSKETTKTSPSEPAPQPTPTAPPEEYLDPRVVEIYYLN